MGLKWESVEDDRQSEPFTLSLGNSTWRAKITIFVIHRNILGL